MIKERPILFSGPMIRAIIDGRKSQTRRIIKPQPEPWKDFHLEGGCQRSDWSFELGDYTEDGKIHRFGLWMHSGFHESRFIPCPYGKPGIDRIWVRETWSVHGTGVWTIADARRQIAADQEIVYAADGGDGPWWPSIHMPREFSRILLKITDIRVERLQDISEDDAKAEGIEAADFHHEEHPLSICFSVMWDKINGPDSWSANPYVWVISFRRIGQNTAEAA